VVQAVVALGSNLPGRFGSSEVLLEAALEALSRAGLRLLAASRPWRSQAWPDPGAPEFRNRVALFETELAAAAVLDLLLATERAFGRERTEVNAPRTLDLDLIDHNGTVLSRGPLRLPHPRAHERLFVIGPLAEVAPEWRHPVLGRTAAELAAAATLGLDARPVLPRCNMEP
jgi:2-amino-4-hydroxy-6-hydroxymethyldihydropteridine diphosphokinase